MGHPERFVQTLRACGAENVHNRFLVPFQIDEANEVRHRNMSDGGDCIFDVVIDGIPLSIKGEGQKEKQLPSTFRLTNGTPRHNGGLFKGIANGASLFAVVGIAPFKKESDAPILAWVGDIAPMFRQCLAENNGDLVEKFHAPVAEWLVSEGLIGADDPRIPGFKRGQAPAFYKKWVAVKSGQKFGHCFSRGVTPGVIAGDGWNAYPSIQMSVTAARIEWEEVTGSFYDFVRERLPVRIDENLLIG